MHRRASFPRLAGLAFAHASLDAAVLHSPAIGARPRVPGPVVFKLAPQPPNRPTFAIPPSSRLPPLTFGPLSPRPSPRPQACSLLAQSMPVQPLSQAHHLCATATALLVALLAPGGAGAGAGLQQHNDNASSAASVAVPTRRARRCSPAAGGGSNSSPSPWSRRPNGPVELGEVAMVVLDGRAL